jgi:hypothetical protein
MRQSRQVVGWGTGSLAGAGAGLVAAVVSIVIRATMHATAPPVVPLVWSAFVAGVLGGLLYAALSRMVSCPVLWLWIISLFIATIDSVLIATQPFPVGRSALPGLPIVGLIVPLRQLGALVGIGQFSQRHFPATAMLANTLIHYVTAVAVALLVPWWVLRKGR